MVDKVTVPVQQEAEDPKYVEEMVAKAEAASQPSDAGNQDNLESSDERPQWLPEKFKSPEELAKAYSELESKLGKPKETTEEKAAPSQDEVAEALESKGLNLEDYSNEFYDKGELSATSYEQLEKAGYPRNIVDQYIEGQKAVASLYESEVKAVAGGDQQFTEMVTWAKANLSPSEIAVYNAAVDSGNKDQAQLAVAGVYQKFAAARPNEPTLMRGNTAAPSAGDIYESVAQLTKDMATEEYKTDPAFRARVQQKLGRSNIL